MSSLVLELQREAMDHRARVSQLLTKAKVIASKLGLSETEQWINLEISGYSDASQIPNYRVVIGELKYSDPFRSWETVEFENAENAALFEKRKIYAGLPEIEDILSEGGVISIGFPPDVMAKILKGFRSRPPDVKYLVSRSQFVSILEGVRQRIVDWTLTLERNGILGEGMSFSPAEKRQVTEAQTVYNVSISGNMAGNVGSVSDDAVVNTGQVIQGVDPVALEALLAKLSELIGTSQFEGRSDVERSLTKLEEESSSGEPRKKTVAQTLRSVLAVITKAVNFAGKAAAEHEIDSYLDSLTL